MRSGQGLESSETYSPESESLRRFGSSIIGASPYQVEASALRAVTARGPSACSVRPASAAAEALRALLSPSKCLCGAALWFGRLFVRVWIARKRKQNSPGRLRCATARPHLGASCRDVGLAESGFQPLGRRTRNESP